ncbi:MAG: hypothetical protein HYZ85_04875 [Candidatus Omnitrophica bacterium]|nr:hypothetical protein [Candidatus Omnitrophota bacterium]
MVALILAILTISTLLTNCAREQKTVVQQEKVQGDDGSTTLLEKETSTTTTVERESNPSLLGGAFQVVGEILAFPFRVVSDLFRFIF